MTGDPKCRLPAFETVLRFFASDDAPDGWIPVSVDASTTLLPIEDGRRDLVILGGTFPAGSVVSVSVPVCATCDQRRAACICGNDWAAFDKALAFARKTNSENEDAA